MLSAETASSEKNIAVEIIELGQNFVVLSTHSV